MSTEPPQLLQIVPTEMEAAMIISRLDAEGIEAWAEGGIVGGFRAEAPGGTSIFVHTDDHARAVEVMGRDPGSPPESA